MGCPAPNNSAPETQIRDAPPVVIRSTDRQNDTSEDPEDPARNQAMRPYDPQSPQQTLSPQDRQELRLQQQQQQTQDPQRRRAPLTDFENLVKDTLGHPLQVFGRNLFLNPLPSFMPSNSISPPADYIIGTGDELKVRTWGKIDIDVRVIVDRDGQIFLPQVGTLTVAGQRADQVPDFLRGAIAQQFKGFNLSVTLGQLRSIQVFVLGQAQRPGVYTISSLSTLVNALFNSGGPSSSGTLRDIQVKRDGKIVTHLDVYNLLLQGDKTADVHLLPGDIIYIPLIGPQIAIDGSVTVPGIFELRGPSTVEAALQNAGGLTPVAGLLRVSLDHINDHAERSVEDLTLNGPERVVMVKGGDILRVFPVSSKIENAVTLRGTVGNPGRYAWHPNMRVSDLIPSRAFLLTRNYYNQQNALDEPALRNPFSVEEPKNSGSATTTVAASTAAAAGFGSTLSVNAAPTEAAPPKDLASHDTEINWNYAVIERLGTTDLTTHLIPFGLGSAIDTPASVENKPLQPGDVVVVYARKDINLPAELRASFVRVDGEVNAPGIYRVEQNETVRDLVSRAGGLAPHSYLYATQLTRESVRLAQEAKLRELVERESREALSPVNVTTSHSPSGGDTSSSDLALRRAYIAELAKIHPTGRVVLQLKPSRNSLDDAPTFVLQDGDHLFVPAVPNTVDVLGSVYNQGALRFIDGGRVRNYLDAAGGSTREGDRRREFIIRADGSIVSRQRSGSFDRLPIFPGDTVVVPARFNPGFNASELFNLTQTLSALALSAVAIKALQ